MIDRYDLKINDSKRNDKDIDGPSRLAVICFNRYDNGTQQRRSTKLHPPKLHNVAVRSLNDSFPGQGRSVPRLREYRLYGGVKLSSFESKSIRYAIFLTSLIALVGVLVVTSPSPSRVGAQSAPRGRTKAGAQMPVSREKTERLKPTGALTHRHEKFLPQVRGIGSNEPLTASRTGSLLSPAASSLCFPASGASIDGTEPTYDRNSFDTPPSGCAPSGTVVHYDQYTFSLSGCATSDITVSLCGTSAAPCDVAGTLGDSYVAVYQKPGGGSDLPGDPIFVQSDACDNLHATNDDFCGGLSELTVSLEAGFFVVVVSPFNSTDTGTYAVNIQAGAACTLTNTPTAADGVVSGTIADGNGAAVAGAVVRLNGTQNRKVITDSNGNYRFDDVETNGFYTVTPSRVNYSFSPSNRSFSLLGQHTNAVFTGSANSSTLSPLDTPEYFVRQQYLDFLNREPDESGLNFWSDQLLSCNGDPACVAGSRTNTSAAFFLSIEFQQTGYEVYRFYKAAYGDLPGAPVPARLNEFLPDTREIAQGVIVNQTGWAQTLENNKQAFANAFVTRSRFTSLYGSMGNGQFVDALNQNAGSVLSQYERDDLVAGLTSGMKTRAQVLRSVAENSQFNQHEFNRAFVLMQYFGYLQRDPNSGPDTDFSGYNFWLNKLNSFGNYQDADMVKAFLVSGEYRGRFPR